MTILVPIEDAQKSLLELCERVEHGEDVILTRDGRPVSRITGVDTPARSGKRILGQMRGRATMADNFNDPMPDFEDSFYCGS